ncbi:MAG: DUF502 domain-containing protein [Bacteroidetes bacterium]|nr:DUF502 domain-containing protein [Bacteroidota bacterium]MBL0019002.1 DUF502 domain-containing protein [Bacteroidota bacterium]
MKKVISKLLSYFLQGVITVVPLMAVVLTGKYLYDLLRQYSFFPNEWLTLLFILLVVFVVGVMAQTIVLKPLFMIFEEVLSRTPGLKFVYSSIKDLMEAFMGEKKRFNKPVLVQISGDAELQRFGFVTDEGLEKLGMGFEGKVAVYIPFSYSVSGQLFIVPSRLLTPLPDVDAAELMKYVLSGGVTDLEDVLDQKHPWFKQREKKENEPDESKD